MAKIKNLPFKLISVTVAVVLWGVVLGSRSVEVTKDVPIEVITSDPVVPSSEIPERISFRLSGPKAFLRAILDRREEPIRVNLVGAKPGVVTYRFFSDNIRLPIGVKVLSIHPTAVAIKLEAVKTRELPIKLELRGVPPEGYQIGVAQLTPSTIKIQGAESKVDGLTELWTVPVDLTQTTQPVERSVNVDLSRFPGIRATGPPPVLRLRVEPTSANFRIRNVGIKVLADYPHRLTDPSLTLLVRASAVMMEQLRRGQLVAEIDLRGKGKGRYEVEPKVLLPEGVGLKKTVPEKVRVTLY